MLDFYIIEDNRPEPNDHQQMDLKFAGGLDDKTFDILQRKGIIDERFDYYSDFRWGTELIAQLRQRISTKKIEADTDVKKLIVLLDMAHANNCGLIAYGD